MAVVMTKYRFKNRDYLVYEKNILSNDFSIEEWAMMSNCKNGVGADCIIVINPDSEAVFFNEYGFEISADIDSNNVLAFHLGEQITSASDISRCIEVRFTEAYIDKIKLLKKKAYIA